MYWDPGDDASRGKGGRKPVPAFLRYWRQITARRAGALLDELGIMAEQQRAKKQAQELRPDLVTHHVVWPAGGKRCVRISARD